MPCNDRRPDMASTTASSPAAAPPPDPHPLNQGCDHLLISPARHQVDETRELCPADRNLDPRRLDRQGRLPDAPYAGQRDHRTAPEPRGDLPEIRGSPHKRRPPRRQPDPPAGPGRQHRSRPANSPEPSPTSQTYRTTPGTIRDAESRSSKLSTVWRGVPVRTLLDQVTAGTTPNPGSPYWMTSCRHSGM